MIKKWMRSVCLLAALALLLSGCAGNSLRAEAKWKRATNPAVPSEKPHFSQMEYTRPDMDALERLLEDIRIAAQGTDADAIMDSVYAYYDAYDRFYTDYSLADIHYSLDLSDTYWEEEYYFCVENAAAVDAGLEDISYILAKSPCRDILEGEDYFGEGYFDDYDGENAWNEDLTALLEQEAALQNQYYSLSGGSMELSAGNESYYDAYGEDLAQVLVDLILVRNQIADHWGYDNYVDFAWDYYYYRDYTPEEMKDYLDSIREQLVPVYREVARTDVWDYGYSHAREQETMSYVRDAAEAMGGITLEAFREMEQRGLYDISYGPNKYTTSFEVYLTSYSAPFVFLCPEKEVYDRLVFAHEFGHLCNDYASGGSYAGTDVLEVFSQGMEYLSLCYSEDAERLAQVKLADSLGTYVEQAAFSSFEYRIYDLETGDLSVAALCDAYEAVAEEFGFDAYGYDPREFITISHFYTNPLYVVSYVVSNDAAMQLYQLERETAGMGLKRFEQTLDTEQSYFLKYLKEARLESPFTPGRLEQVRDLFAEALLS